MCVRYSHAGNASVKQGWTLHCIRLASSQSWLTGRVARQMVKTLVGLWLAKTRAAKVDADGRACGTIGGDAWPRHSAWKSCSEATRNLGFEAAGAAN